MKLGYCMAWFEDSKEYVESLVGQIKDYLEDLGFEMDLTVQTDVGHFDDIIKTKDLNLILVDQNLSKGQKGARLVDAIRHNEVYTEVLLYSQYEDYLKDETQLEGVFFADRPHLLEKAKKVIDLTIKKNQDMASIRGLFIAETIDATSQMEGVISDILGLSGTQQEFFADSIVQEEFFTEMAKFKIIQRYVKQKFKDLDLKTQNAKGEERARLTKLKADLQKADNIFKDFQSEVIELRNVLAHAKKTKDKKNCLAVRKKKDGEFQERMLDDGECRRIRASFVKHERNLKELDELLKKLG